MDIATWHCEIGRHQLLKSSADSFLEKVKEIEVFVLEITRTDVSFITSIFFLRLKIRSVFFNKVQVK